MRVDSGRPTCELWVAVLLSEAVPGAPPTIASSNGKLLSAFENLQVCGIGMSPSGLMEHTLHRRKSYFRIGISTEVERD